jgi:uncharacterized protein
MNDLQEAPLDGSTGPSSSANRLRGGRRPRARLLLCALHRDVGFICIGLTLVYVISGFLLNHRDDFDSDYRTRTSHHHIGQLSALLGSMGTAVDSQQLSAEQQQQLGQLIAKRLGLAAPSNAFWRNARTFSVFFGEGERNVVDYHPDTEFAEHRILEERTLLRAMNRLHLNRAPRAWTYLADGYAVLLAFLALSGPLIVRGRRGLAGTGGILIAAGIAIPAIAMLLL